VADFFTKHLKKYLFFEKLSKYAKILYYRFITDYDDSDQYLTELIVEESSRSEKPFFIWAHYMGPHSPYYPQREYDFPSDTIEKIFDVNNKLTRARNVSLKGKNGLIHEKFSEDEIELLKELYVYELKILEKNLLNLLDHLKDDGLLENTHVIITADHGEEFYEHERYHHEYHLYDELIHVPLYLVGGGIDGGKEDNMVSHIDIAPTILDLVSVEKPMSFVGVSFFNHVRDYVISETSNITTNVDVSVMNTIQLGNSKISVRNGEWKYIFNMMDDGDELYNIKKDDFEENNLGDDQVPEEIRNSLFKHIELILKTSKLILRK